MEDKVKFPENIHGDEKNIAQKKLKKQNQNKLINIINYYKTTHPQIQPLSAS